MSRMPAFRTGVLLFAWMAAVVLGHRPGPAAAMDGFHRAVLENLKAPWSGDLDGMVQRGTLRVLVVCNRTNYFIDRFSARGATFEAMEQFERFLNARLKNNHSKISILFIPVARDQLLPFLVNGLGDIAAADLAVTPEGQRLVDFCTPFYSDIRELVVAGPRAPALNHLDNLSGKTIAVRRSGSHHRTLLALNRRLNALDQAPVVIRHLDEYLETETVLEMVADGLFPFAVADDYLAEFWSRIFSGLKVYPHLPLKTNGQIAWAVRKNCPKLKKRVNAFVPQIKKGSLLGNLILKRYFKNSKYVRNSPMTDDAGQFKNTIANLKRYAGNYEFDWLLVAALAYQESRFDQNARSPEGAVGVMQILPSTAAAPPVNISDVHLLEKNIHAGIKYLRYIHDRYFSNAGLDRFNRTLFAFAAYNAGPARVAFLRKKARQMGLDPNVWFQNVEIAAARVIGRETVQYVNNILKYYILYRQARRSENNRFQPPNN